VGFPPIPVELVHVVLLGPVDVDGIVVKHLLGGEQIHLPNHPAAGNRPVDDDHVIRRGATQADVLGGVGVAHPVVAVPAAVEHIHFGQVIQDLGHLAPAEGFPGEKRQFESGAFEVAHEDHQVVRIQGSVFGAAAEEIVGIVDDVLVGGAARRDQDHGAEILAPPGPTRLLPSAGDGPGVTGHDADVETPDIDTEFQGVGRHHRADGPVPQTTLDGPPFPGQVAAPVSAHFPALESHPASRLLQVGQQEFDPHPAAGEDDELGPG
jgi:hypothetical protein